MVVNFKNWAFILLIQFAICQVTLPDKPNPHTDQSCEQCHSSIIPNKNDYLIGACNECHIPMDIELNHKHPVGLFPMEIQSISVPSHFPLLDNKILCITCHQPECTDLKNNSKFLRKTRYMDKVDFCYQCHDKNQYIHPSPHNQYTMEGQIIEQSCIECHGYVPNKYLNKDDILLKVNNKGLCIQCHHNSDHEKVHLNKPIKENSPEHFTYKKSIVQQKIDLPLSNGSLITCITCHYSHEQGIVPSIQAKYLTSNNNQFYLRLPQVNTCLACHEHQ